MSSYEGDASERRALSIYLVGEKLMTFADAAGDHPEFDRELPRFLAAI